MPVEDIFSQIVMNPTFQMGAVILIIGIAILKFTGKLGTNVKIISRPEIIKKKMIKTLEMNKSKTHILKQHDNIIGLMSNVGFYQIGAEGKEKRLYLFLFSPKWIGIIPKFWVQDVMIISDDYIIRKEVLELHTVRGMPVGTPTIKNWELKEDYFIDDYFNFKMNLGDQTALDFVKMKLSLDESETSSGAYLAQAMRLSSVDYSKAYEPTQADIQEEKLASSQGGS